MTSYQNQVLFEIGLVVCPQCEKNLNICKLNTAVSSELQKIHFIGAKPWVNVQNIVVWLKKIFPLNIKEHLTSPHDRISWHIFVFHEELLQEVIKYSNLLLCIRWCRENNVFIVGSGRDKGVDCLGRRIKGHIS